MKSFSAHFIRMVQKKSNNVKAIENIHDLLNTLSDLQQRFLLPQLMLQLHIGNDYFQGSKSLVESNIFQRNSVYKEELGEIKMQPYQ